ncbi:UDP-glucuronic acid decarboxylase family protein [Natrialbaceae archaeon GCM10025810]|uniref:UDP-glucuronic acid decarboxylase family protein n=1 Tax=Halovalidus salilacus TaxID=3075124 RepID=UPI00361C8074
MVGRTAIVTGGAGFVGSHLCESLLSDNYRVICVDNFESGQSSNISHLEPNPDFVIHHADVRNEMDLPPMDEIYHLASRASPKDFTKFPVDIALTNTEGTRKLLDHAVENNARMLFASTSEVYGDPEAHPQTESYNGNVNIRGVRGCYDEAKRFGETLTVAYYEKYGLDVRTARIFNTYGPRMRRDDGRVVPTFLTQALNSEDITVYGDGSQTRSFCFVDDLVAGIRALMAADGLDGEVVNLGRRNEITILELAETVIDVCGSDSEITFEPIPEDDPQRRCPDLDKAFSVLDWEPKIPLKEGLKRTAESYQNQQNASAQAD